ncbi:MAG: hypothetical protein WCV90_04530 [Candidatus Woesearchaeota archaeon]
MVNNKGDISITVIIVAAIALIVLVVLVAIFTGRITIFQQGVAVTGDTELTTMRITYGQCRPVLTAETTFKSEFSKATVDEAKEQARTNFAQVINTCKDYSSDKAICEANGCRWG